MSSILPTGRAPVRPLFLTLVALWLVLPAAAQQRPALTLEKLFASSEFSGSYFRGGNWAEEGPVLLYVDADDESGATSLVQWNLETDERQTLIDGLGLVKPDAPAGGDDGLVEIEDYQYSRDGSKVLLYTDSEQVWRLNTKGYYYVFDVEAGTLTPVSDRSAGFQMFAKFNPDATQVAFVRDRDLFVVDLATGAERQLTDSGSPGGVINGTFDWVYEEEFGLRDGFRWSPDGRRLAFFQLDESGTRDFAVTDYRDLYPEYNEFRYPKAGETNSEIRIGVIDVATGETRFFDTDTWMEGGDETEYIASMGWTPEGEGARVWMLRLNRDQNVGDLLYGDPGTMAVTTVLNEEIDSYLEVETGFSDLATGTVTYLHDGAHFVLRSDRDGYSHLYLYRNDGTFVGRITEGAWDVTDFHGVDEATGYVYFTATAEGPMERHLYRVGMPGTEARGANPQPEQLTVAAGWHSVNPSNDFAYFIDTYSNATTPPVTTLHLVGGGPAVEVLSSNEDLIEKLVGYDLPAVEFMTVPGADGTALNAYLVKPRDFDPSRAYPLLIHTYGGPGSQEVRDAWGGQERLWHHYLAEEYGVLVAGVDNRGTGGRGKAFKTLTQLNLGPMEAEDQIAAAQWFGAQPYVDEDRMGIWGWSYGGYLTLLAMLYGDGPETFAAGVAVAPVTNWRYYDTIYTERYLSTPQKNPEGYDAGSPVTYAENLRDDQALLLVHGDADDNVHVQNTVVMADALIAAGKQFELMIYPGRNHGIYGGNTRLHLYTMLTDFVREHLAEPEMATAMDGTN